MALTATTTDEELTARVATARQDVANMLAADGAAPRAEDIAKAVNVVAKAEGEVEAMFRYRHALQNGLTGEQAFAFVMSAALNGADDAWSGRSNDVRRAKFDGFLAAANDLRYL